VTHGANEGFFPVAGKSVASVRKALATVLSIPGDALPMVGGQIVGPDHILAAGEELTFAKQTGHKGVGSQVWTDEEFCKFFKLTRDDLHSWVAQGLKVGRCLDGSLRISETAVDEFFRGSEVPSPYLTAEQAAHYLRTTVKGIYSLLERRKLRKLPGSRTVLFTRDLLDAYVRGGEE
jgi:excisionase family DNA binding protein